MLFLKSYKKTIEKENDLQTIIFKSLVFFGLDFAVFCLERGSHPFFSPWIFRRVFGPDEMEHPLGKNKYYC